MATQVNNSSSNIIINLDSDLCGDYVNSTDLIASNSCRLTGSTMSLFQNPVVDAGWYGFANNLENLSAESINVTGVTVRASAAPFGTYNIKVYMRIGAYQSNMDSNAGWTLMDDNNYPVNGAFVTGGGSDVDINFATPFTIPAGQVAAIYYVIDNGTTLNRRIMYSSTPDLSTSDDCISIFDGAAINFIFSGIVFTSRSAYLRVNYSRLQLQFNQDYVETLGKLKAVYENAKNYIKLGKCQEFNDEVASAIDCAHDLIKSLRDEVVTTTLTSESSQAALRCFFQYLVDQRGYLVTLNENGEQIMDIDQVLGENGIRVTDYGVRLYNPCTCVDQEFGVRTIVLPDGTGLNLVTPGGGGEPEPEPEPEPECPVIDDYTIFDSNNYNFVAIFNNPPNNPTIVNGKLSILTNTPSTAAYVWNQSQTLSNVGSVVTIEIDLIDTDVFPTLYTTAGLLLSSDPMGINYLEIRYSGRNQNFLFISGPLVNTAPAFLNLNNSLGNNVLRLEVISNNGTVITLKLDLTGPNINQVMTVFDVTANELYFGPVSYFTNGTNRIALLDNLSFCPGM